MEIILNREMNTSASGKSSKQMSEHYITKLHENKIKETTNLLSRRKQFIPEVCEPSNLNNESEV